MRAPHLVQRSQSILIAQVRADVALQQVAHCKARTEGQSSHPGTAGALSQPCTAQLTARQLTPSQREQSRPAFIQQRAPAHNSPQPPSKGHFTQFTFPFCSAGTVSIFAVCFTMPECNLCTLESPKGIWGSRVTTMREIPVTMRGMRSCLKK